MQTAAWGGQGYNRVDPGAWEPDEMSLTTAHGVCELVLLMECNFLAVGLSQRWYVKVQSTA